MFDFFCSKRTPHDGKATVPATDTTLDGKVTGEGDRAWQEQPVAQRTGRVQPEAGGLQRARRKHLRVVQERVCGGR